MPTVPSTSRVSLSHLSLASRTALGSIALALALGGCSTASSSLSAVSDSVSSVGSAFSSQKGEPVEVPMFVASTRKKPGEAQGDVSASFSLQTVSVPPGHKAGVIEAPRFGSADAKSHFVVIRKRALDTQDFNDAVATHISGRVGSSRDILVYVHGFNTSLEEARYRLAQIVADGGFAGVPILFTWQSKGELFAYESDKDSATASRDALQKLLIDMAGVPGVGRVHVLAHSMGAWLSMEALREASIGGRRDLNGKLGSVMLAAPDIDLGVFRQQVSRLDPSHISVFVSRDDRALSLSSRIAGDRPRLGAMDPSNAKDASAIDAMGVRVYDISSLSSGFIGHDTYANAPDAVRQIGATLTKKRESDANTQAILDAGVGPTAATPPPAPSAPVSNAPIIGEALAPLPQ